MLSALWEIICVTWLVYPTKIYMARIHFIPSPRKEHPSPWVTVFPSILIHGFIVVWLFGTRMVRSGLLKSDSTSRAENGFPHTRNLRLCIRIQILAPRRHVTRSQSSQSGTS